MTNKAVNNIPKLNQTPPASNTDIARAVNLIMEGHLNSNGTVTLTQNGTTTILYDNHAAPTTTYFFWPQTANAATVTGIWYDPTSVPVNGPGMNGQITIHHSAVNQPDLTFGYVAFT